MVAASTAERGIDLEGLARLEEVARAAPGRTVVLRSAACAVRRRPARRTRAPQDEIELVVDEGLRGIDR